ncbi:hypothetical protein ILYODFUR_010128 [Ilyodon furcidens]|uniref:Uncharacterized protein n=1 Tax=Ilyodon furcidens TaxID=33524 RepID=A0ABV0V1V4_9TELE
MGLPSPLLFEEIEEGFGGSRLVLAPQGYEPGQNCSTHPMPCPVASSSRHRRRCHLLSNRAAAAAQLSLSAAPAVQLSSPTEPAAQLSSPAAFAAQPSTSAAASTTTELPAGFSSRPARRCHWSSAPLRDPTSSSGDFRRERGVWSGSPEQPGATAHAVRPPGKLPTPAWVQCGLAAASTACSDS